jgi:diguanylate cyclase (GGDEF)-like protein
LRALRQGQWTAAWAAAEIGRDLDTFLYVGVSTALVFALFGVRLGAQADRLLDLSLTDALTELKNVRLFRERLGEELGRAARDSRPLSLLFIDVDGLKQVNDRLGHRTGDEALVSVAAAIRRAARGSDVAARWGGDEFVLLAPNTDERAALVLAERVRAQVHASSQPRLTVSIGVAVAEKGKVEAAPLLERADAALYQAKRAGRNRVAAASAAVGR